MATVKSKGRDPEKVRAAARRHYLKHCDRIKATQRARNKPYSQWTPEKRQALVEWKKRERRARGIQPKPSAALPDLWAQNAKQAWQWWLKTCPDSWMRSYYRAKGKPWNNPRIEGKNRYRIRYWLDPAFRAREIEKVQTLKVRRAERIAANNDGSLTGEVIVSLFANATHCIYCLNRMRSVEKSLDHVVALANGGAHALSNVVVCCKTCNTRRGTQSQYTSVSVQLIHGGA